MKAVIVYYSMSGNVQYVAENIAANIQADLVQVKPQKAYPDKGIRKFLWGGKCAMMGETPALEPYSFDGAAYDTVIFGTPVWASNIAPPLRTFIKENADALKGKRIGVALCYAGGGADKASAKLKALLDIESFAAELVLIDPKDKPKEEHVMQIKAFCDALGE